MLKIGIIFTILFVIFIPQFHTQSYDNAKINCFIRHLKAKKILRDDFQETPTIRDITHCDKVVDSAKNVYFKKIEQSAVLDLGSLNLENMLESERRCFDDDIKTREIGDYMLKLIVYRSLGVVSVNLVVDQEKTRDHILDLIAMSASYCTFNTLYDTFNNERIKNYCKRRYVLDNNILGLKEYNLTLNPFNVHIPKIDYEQRIQKIVADESKFIENKINSERSDDEPRFKFKDDEALTFLSRNWATIFLTELNISPEEKDEKKKQYSKDLFAFHKSKNIIPIEDECCDYLRVKK
ncbi:hypothetical protein PVAND_005674 [Polypedilum vanderplanki]|uniref:Uncharacterized protein n=1 Tax=Polypedilum vanderplanki TaxID=319348 RepID=A0A9J6C1N5_POLVA|nr:hypothetical protein PVAND_005674 [Polypedilum vanderplanki]